MTSAVFLDFKGMNVEEVTKLRAEFRKAGVEYRSSRTRWSSRRSRSTPWRKLERRARRA